MDNDDMYVDKSDFVPAKIPRKQLQMMDTIAEGRFAIVRKAHLNGDKDRSVVAAKALKSKQYDFLLFGHFFCFRHIADINPFTADPVKAFHFAILV